MTPADIAGMDDEGRDLHAEQMVSAALELSGFDPGGIIKRCRSRHGEVCRQRGIALDDFEGACSVASEVLRKGLDDEMDKALSALERSILSRVGARNRHERRHLQASTRARLKAGRHEMRGMVRRMVMEALRDAEAGFSEAEDDFTRMMREAMEG